MSLLHCSLAVSGPGLTVIVVVIDAVPKLFWLTVVAIFLVIDTSRSLESSWL